VNPRARRISLRVDARAGLVVATAPSQRGLSQALAFARTRTTWMAQRLGAGRTATALEPGAVIPLRGRPVTLVAGPGASAARLEPGAIISGGEGEAFARRIRRLLRAEALRDLTTRTHAHALALGSPRPTVAVNDARTRWGSCSPPRGGEAHGRIRYAWRLVLAPPEVLDYVAAHEVAHLAEANHSAAFWAVAARLYGDVAPARRWLKQHGAALHAID
jgi:predicted metal-dependent hydrolase